MTEEMSMWILPHMLYELGVFNYKKYDPQNDYAAKQHDELGDMLEAYWWRNVKNSN